MNLAETIYQKSLDLLQEKVIDFIRSRSSPQAYRSWLCHYKDENEF